MRCVIAVTLIVLLVGAPAFSQIIVTTLTDESDNPWTDCPPPGTNDCSLREAIFVADWNGNPSDTITFDPTLDGGTIVLDPSLGGLWIGGDPFTTVDATGLATGITIDANGISTPISLNSQFLTIQGNLTITNAGPGGTAVVINPGADFATLRGITVSNNAGSGISLANVTSAILDGVTADNNRDVGINIWSNGASGTQIRDCVVRNTTGTGIYINGSNTAISNCTVESNGTGGITVDSGGTNTSVDFTTVRNNTGSGIYSKAMISVTNSTITSNSFGGISLDAGADFSSISSSNISNNGGGSGIFMRGVRTISITGSTITGNFAEGIAIVDSSTVTIQNSTVSDNGQNRLSSGIFVFGASQIIAISNNDIRNNGGNGITLQEDFSNPGRAPDIVSIENNIIDRNGFLATDGVGIHIAGAVGTITGGIYILGNDIFQNAAQGILIEKAAGSDGPQNVTIGDFDPISKIELRNYIYSNGQEGVLIRDKGTRDNIVQYNRIGVDRASNPAPNGNSGLALVAETTRNFVTSNYIRYNRWQNVLISGAGTSFNIVGSNTIMGGADTDPPTGYDNVGVVINDGATDNFVGRNTIQWHVFDGVQVVGPGTDRNEISGNTITRNGRGIAVIHDYTDAAPPDPDAPAYDPQTDSFLDPGPAETRIANNEIVSNNNDGILVRRDGGGTIVENNTISNNGAGSAGNGIRLVGSSPIIQNNTIENNAENGILALVFFGRDDSPNTTVDDVLSIPTIENNTIGGNGTAVAGDNVGAGIYAVDTPIEDLPALYQANTWSAPDDVISIQQDWYGYVRVEDTHGTPVSGATVVIEQAGGAWTYTSALDDGNGNYGPSGFTINSARSYFQIVEERVTNDGEHEIFTPQRVYLQTDPAMFVEYSYNGRFPDPPGEPGGAIITLDWARYQFAIIIIQQEPPIGGDPPIYGNIVIFPTPELPFGSGPDRDLNRNGSLTDCVLRYRNVETGRTHNTGVIVSCTPGDIDIYATTVVFVGGQGKLGLYDLSTHKVTFTEIAGRQPAIYGSTIVFETPKGSIALWDLDADTVKELAPGTEPALWGKWGAFRGANGHIWLYDLSKGEAVDTGEVGREPAIHETIVAFTAPSSAKGVEVIRYYDLTTGKVHDTGAVGSHPAVWERYIVFETQERQIKQDLNGDGDRRDTVIRYFDRETQQVFSSGLVGYDPDLYRETVAFWSYEPELKQDLNSDGDLHDPVVTTYKIGTGTELPGLPQLSLQVRSESQRVQFEIRGLGVGKAQLELWIYDLAGRLVYTAQGESQESSLGLLWELRDLRGHPVANGVYLAIVEVRDSARGILMKQLSKIAVLRRGR